MRALRAWSTDPGTYQSEIQEFTAGATAVSESRVHAVPHPDGTLEAIQLIAAVPPESSELAKLTAKHETGELAGVGYFARWALLLPSITKPYALARLDLRLAGPKVFEARLLFDLAGHAACLWAAAHTGWIRLVSPERIPQHLQMMSTALQMPPALILATPPKPLADALAKLGLNDPFA